MEKKLDLSNIKSWLTKIYYFFFFTIYIRTLIESFQMLMISCSQEIKNFEPTNVFKLISLIMAFAINLLCIFLVMITVSQILKSTHKFWDELFYGLKKITEAKFYIVLLLSRRYSTIFFGIICKEFYFIPKVAIIAIFHFNYWVYCAFSKPFKFRRDNIILIINESVLIILLWTIIYHTVMREWSRTGELFFLAITTSNWIIIGIVVLVDSIRQYKNKYWKGKKRQQNYEEHVSNIEHEAESISNSRVSHAVLNQEEQKVPSGILEFDKF